MDSAAAERPSSYAVNFPPLLPAPAPAVAGAMGVANHKSVLCMKWREGRCHNGVACRYAHGEEDQRIVPEMRVGGGGTSMHARSSPPRDGASSGSTASIAMAACRIEEQRHGRGGESFILPRSRRKRQYTEAWAARGGAARGWWGEELWRAAGEGQRAGSGKRSDARAAPPATAHEEVPGRRRASAFIMSGFKSSQAEVTESTPRRLLTPPSNRHADWRRLLDAAVARVLDLFRLGYLFSPRWIHLWHRLPLYLHDRQFTTPSIPAGNVAQAITNVLELHVGNGV
uniref:C3H1-type domain-containing protein n=1 Tax=Oryza nivara TaxID=4536 RepID=A0A0E0H0N0_ORYNI